MLLLGAYSLPRLHQEETEKLNKSITSKEIEKVVKSLQELKA